MIRIFLFLISINVLNIGVAQDAASKDNAAPLVRGCYLSVKEYLSNSPSFVDSFYVDSVKRKHPNWLGTSNVIPTYEGKKYKRVKNIWGFCDGENVYVYHQNEFFLLESDSIWPYFDGFNIIDYRDVPLSAAFTYDAGASMALDRAKSNKTRYYIDLHTGWALHPNPKFNDGNPAEHVVFYRNSKKEASMPMDVFVNDSLYYRFSPDAFSTLKFLSGTQEIKICLGEKNNLCNTFELDPKEIDYFKFSIPAKTKELTLEKVSDSEGEFYSDSAMKAQEKRKRKEAKH